MTAEATLRAELAPADEATDRIQKILSVALGLGALLFGALTLAPLRDQFSSFALWWSIPTVVLTFGVPALMALIARWTDRRTLRILASVVAIGYAASLLSMDAALIGGHLAATPESPWLLEVTAIGTSGAALSWRPWAVWPYTGLIALLVFVDRIACGGPGMLELGWQDSLYTLLFASVLASLALVTIGAGRRIDRATHSARVEATEAAALRAQRRERVRMEALMHDSILQTLLSAAREGDQFREAAARQAQKALAELEELQRPAAEGSAVDPEQFLWFLQGITTEISPGARFSYEFPRQDGDRDRRPVPRRVAEAVGEALAESLRNSVNHAERPGGTNRAVHVQLSEHVLRVSVLDDGPGFDPATVSSRRLGIRLSIRGRMDQLEGGSGTVSSRPGSGTTVVLEWRHP